MATYPMDRVWAMPTSETFSIKPIGDLVRRYLADSACSIDPFARNKTWATLTNDLNPNTSAEYHLECLEFLALLHAEGIRSDLVIMDPPYSPRQIKECYDSIGRVMTEKDALSSVHTQRRAAVDRVLEPGGIVITCGWNTVGMGKGAGYEIVEILLVCHGSGHYDTITLVERKL